MTRDELLTSLRDFDLSLRRFETIEFVKHQELEFRTQFAADLATLSAVIGSIEHAQLADISARLDALAPDLKQGIADLGTEIDKVDKTIAIFTAVGTVVGLAARVAGLVK